MAAIEKLGGRALKDYRQDVYDNGKLSTGQDAANEVYSLYEYCKDAYKSWFEAENVDLKYYKGEQNSNKSRRVRRVNDNECYAAVDAIVPKILENIQEYELFAVQEDDIELVRSLSQRLVFAKELFNYDAQVIELVRNVVKRGRGVIKCFPDVSFYNINPRRVMRDPDAGSFNTSLYILDSSLYSRYEVIERYGKKGKGLAGAYNELDAERDQNSHPKLGGESVISVAALDPGGEGTVTKYKLTSSIKDWKAADKILVIECWIHDRTEREGYLLYPEGRIVTVGVGAHQDGSVNVKNGENIILLNDQPNGYRRLYQASRNLANNGQGLFPIFEFLYEGNDELSSNGVVRDIMDLQDALNFAWEQLLENMKRVNKNRNFYSNRTGLKPGDLTNASGEEVFLPAESADEPINNLIYTQQIPPFAGQSLVVIDALKQAIRNIPGLVDVFRGETPGQVTAYSAIAELGKRADNRISIRADSISYKLKILNEALAYIAQEFDDETMEIQDKSNSNAKEYVTYEPDQVRGVQWTLVGMPRIGIQERVAVTEAAIQTEQMLPGSGDMILSDPRYQTILSLLRDLREQQAMLAEQTKVDEFSSQLAQMMVGSQNQVQRKANAVQK